MTRHRPARHAAALSAVVFLSLAGPAFPVQAQLPGPSSASRFAPTLQAIKSEDWGTAQSMARTAGDPAAVDIATWRQLSDGDGGFFDYQRFLAERPGWPGESRIRRKAEERMPPNLSAGETRAFFNGRRPLTGHGSLMLAKAYAEQGQAEQARAEAVRGWRELSLTADEESRFLAAWSSAIAPHHAERLDMLLWRGLGGEATRMFGRVDAGRGALARARLALQARDKGVNALIDQVPGSLAGDAGLAHDRFEWRYRADLRDGAEELILERSTSAAALGRPAAWASRRVDMVRNAERSGRARTAYILAARHFMQPDDGYVYSDCEWLAGWIALRSLNDAAAAEAHFSRFLASVTTPISLGRGYYWLGRAREAKGDASGAREAYADGARWQTSFYGQLAAEKIGAAADPSLSGIAPPTDWKSAAILSDPRVRAGVLLHYSGERRLSHWLLTHTSSEAPTPRDHAALAYLALELDRPEVAVRIAKNAARDGIVFSTPYYPVIDLATSSGPVSPELALSIARQESEMNIAAVSHAGARGLMQLMPGTAQLVSRRLGIRYDLNALTTDWRYNARLGTDYLAGLIDQFGSLPLAAAGYNAGPNRVTQWISRYGDPRGGRIDMVDWIETIPFDETRNYVQRVMEGLHVYQARLSGQAQPPRLAASVLR